MLDKVRKTISRYSLLKRADRILVAVSGGADSVALLSVLTKLAREYDIFLLVAHLNHGLRGEEADREEEFVRLLSCTLGLEYVTEKIDIKSLRLPGKSLEELCREQRYSFLRRVAADCRAGKIALGHHLQDQAETVLMHFLRGSGAEGLKGMLPLRDSGIIRPLLEVQKQEILTYLCQEGLSFMEDSSNRDECFLRNRLRHHLLPHLRDNYNPRLEENLAHTAEILRMDDDFISRETEAWLRNRGLFPGKEELAILLPEFLELHEALQHRIVRTLLTWVSPVGTLCGYRHVRAVLGVVAGNQGSTGLDLPGGVWVRREYDRLIVTLHRTMYESADYRYSISVPGIVTVKEADMILNLQWEAKRPVSCPEATVKVAYLDYEALHPPLVIRNFQPGDRMQPLGMTGRKKLKSIFIDAKIPRFHRQQWPLLADQESVVWIIGLRQSEKMRVGDGTGRVVRIEIV